MGEVITSQRGKEKYFPPATETPQIKHHYGQLSLPQLEARLPVTKSVLLTTIAELEAATVKGEPILLSLVNLKKRISADNINIHNLKRYSVPCSTYPGVGSVVSWGGGHSAPVQVLEFVIQPQLPPHRCDRWIRIYNRCHMLIVTRKLCAESCLSIPFWEGIRMMAWQFDVSMEMKSSHW